MYSYVVLLYPIFHFIVLSQADAPERVAPAAAVAYARPVPMCERVRALVSTQLAQLPPSPYAPKP